MKNLLLTQNKFAIVDDEDYVNLVGRKWQYNSGYASTYINGKNILLHRYLLNPELDKEVDHINRNKLDNRRSNLRVCTRKENGRNRSLAINNSSGYHGVYFSKTEKRKKRWTVSIRIDGIKKTIGRYLTGKQAAKAYDEKALKYHGEFATTNFPKYIDFSKSKI